MEKCASATKIFDNHIPASLKAVNCTARNCRLIDLVDRSKLADVHTSNNRQGNTKHIPTSKKFLRRCARPSEEMERLDEICSRRFTIQRVAAGSPWFAASSKMVAGTRD
jgi:hypothetical protein